MSFRCCGVKYSKSDIETYWCIETDIIEKPQKTIKGKRISKEIVETLTCKKNGCIQVHIKSYYKENNKHKLLKMTELYGRRAERYLLETIPQRKNLPQIPPFEPVSTRSTFFYGAKIDGETQRARLINNSDWAPRSKEIKTKCITKYSD